MHKLLIIKIGGLLLGIAGAFCFGQTVDFHHKLEPSLKTEVSIASSEYLDIIIQLSNRLDISSLYGQWKESKLSQSQINQKLISGLSKHAASTQAGLIEQLKNMPGIIQSSLRTYWIANLVRCRAHISAIKLLSKSEDVGLIMKDVKLQLDDAGLNYSYSPSSPQGHEPGHDIIKAPELWALGYTGYGRKVLILDSGMDLSHPALVDQYAGNYVNDSLAWFDPASGTNSPVSCGVHGNQVGGIILGLERQTSDTIGVAFESLWMASPVAPDPGKCLATDAIAALEWALNPDGDPTTSHDIPDVINNSWSVVNPLPGQECESIFKDILDALEMAGIAVIWSAGNQGPGSSTIASPKNINTNPVNAFCVGAIRGSVTGFPIFPNSSRGPSRCELSADTIKPEVVAPGASIRSSGLNGTYTSSSGTSFSTPHVSGATLLLKEAFPNLTGKDLLMALYLTAQDLGQAGEDNLYGRGLINVSDAYQYLLNQGNVPAQVSKHNDVAITNLQTNQSSLCESPAFPSFSLLNKGTDSLREVLISWQYSNGWSDSLFWTGILAPDSQVQISLPIFNPEVYGNFTLDIQLIKPNDNLDYHYLDNRKSILIPFLPPPPPVLPTDIICIGENALLRSQVDTTGIAWFADSTSISPLGKGKVFLTGPIHSDTSFFAAYEMDGLIGCKARLTIKVDSSTVNASFEMSDTVIYLAQGGQIAFNDQSVGANNWSWDFGDGNSSSASSPVHTYTKAGTFVISLLAGNGRCFDAFVDTLTVLSWALDLPSISENKISIFPNPCPVPCSLKLHHTYPFVGNVQLLNIQGQVIKKLETSSPAGNTIFLKMDDLPSGFYLLKVISDPYTAIYRIHLL